MTRHLVPRATPRLTGGEERPQGACVGHPEPFDDLIDYTSGPTFLFARAEARQICGSCPLMATCLSSNRHEQWAAAILGIDPRQPATRRDTCGKPRGASAHHKAGEHACDECKRHERERFQRRKGAA